MCGKTSVDQPENAINIGPSNLETYIAARRQWLGGDIIFSTAACKGYISSRYQDRKSYITQMSGVIDLKMASVLISQASTAA